MAIAAALFYDPNDSDKETLVRRITPGDDVIEEQIQRWKDLADYLREDLQVRTGYTVSTWLQGSYKYKTQIRPARKGDEFDIDLGVYFHWSGTPDKGKFTAKQLKGHVQKSLEAYPGEDVVKVAPVKTRCSRIHFEGDFHIDVPSYHLDPDRDARTLATENGWENSDPQAFYDWFNGRFDDEERARARRHIKYVKCWAALRFDEGARPSSTLLTVLVAEALDMIDGDDLADDDGFLAVVREITRRLEESGEVPNPVNGDENLNRLDAPEFTDFLAKLRALRSIAEKAVECETHADAADRWSEAFDHFFPLPAVAEVRTVLEKSNSLVPIVTPRVRVIAKAANGMIARTYEDYDRIGPIPKNYSIEFQVANAERFPAGTTFQWVVRNAGQEAEYVNDLGHRAGRGLRAYEHSAYNGTHYMDCVARQNGRIVGMLRIPVEISGAAIPRRNPLKRPEWTRFRSAKR